MIGVMEVIVAAARWAVPVVIDSIRARSVSLLQQNTTTTIEACCIIHGKMCCNTNIATNDATAAFCCIKPLQHKACCNDLMQRFLATRAHHCNDLLQHERTVATICCNTSTPLQRFVAIGVGEIHVL